MASALEKLCDDLGEALAPLGPLDESLRARAAALRRVAEDISKAARQVPSNPDVRAVVASMVEAASAMQLSGAALRAATDQGRGYIGRTVGPRQGGTEVPVDGPPRGPLAAAMHDLADKAKQVCVIAEVVQVVLSSGPPLAPPFSVPHGGAVVVTSSARTADDAVEEQQEQWAEHEKIRLRNASRSADGGRRSTNTSAGQ